MNLLTVHCYPIISFCIFFFNISFIQIYKIKSSWTNVCMTPKCNCPLCCFAEDIGKRDYSHNRWAERIPLPSQCLLALVGVVNTQRHWYAHLTWHTKTHGQHACMCHLCKTLQCLTSLSQKWLLQIFLWAKNAYDFLKTFHRAFLMLPCAAYHLAHTTNCHW